MILVEIAAYIMFITLILFFSTRVLWLFFLLFCYRFWESALSREFLQKHIQFIEGNDYFIAILILAVITYFGVITIVHMIGMDFLKYVFLIVMALYVLRQPEYTIKEILFFKDYLEANGMWSIDYWIAKIKELFVSSDGEKLNIFENVWNGLKDIGARFMGYIQKL